MLYFLFVAYTLISVVILASYYFFHNIGNLIRSDIARSTTGLMHPATAACIASAGVIIIITCRLLWNWSWTRKLLFPAIIIEGWLMYLAHSRVAIIITFFLTLGMILLLGNRLIIALSMILLSIFISIYICSDPSFELSDRIYKGVSKYMLRGQTKEGFMSGSGRNEIWPLVWDSFLDSPLYGHGYFMTSKTGKINLWGEYQDLTAHNLALQVLVSTGLIGGILLVWALWRPISQVRRAFYLNPYKKKVAIFFSIIILWSLGWSLVGNSFLSGITPTSLLFPIALGIAAGWLSR